MAKPVVWIPLGIICRITAQKCNNCGHEHRTSELYLRQQSAGKYSRATVRDTRISANTPIPTYHENLYWQKALIKVKSPFCHDCFVEREVKKTESYDLSKERRYVESEFGWVEKREPAPDKPKPLHERVSLSDL